MNRYYFDEKNHIHLLDNKPLYGTSTISKIISSGSALNWWASGKAVETLGWIKKEYTPEDKYKKNCLNEEIRLQSAKDFLVQNQGMNKEQYLALLDTAYKAHSVRLKESAVKGVNLHSELERYVKNEIIEIKSKYVNELKPFIEWCKNNVKKWLFSELHVYSEELWTGGIIDAGYIDNNNEFVLCDFKSGKAWFTGFVQCGGYAKELITNGVGFNNNGDIIFKLDDYLLDIPASLAIFPFKGGFTEPTIIKGKTQKYMKAFEYCANLYKLKELFENDK